MSEIEKNEKEEEKENIPQAITEKDVQEVIAKEDSRKKDSETIVDNNTSNNSDQQENSTTKDSEQITKKNDQVVEISDEEKEQMNKSGFTNYNEWLEAKNEGFDTKEDWDEWIEIKNSGFSDVNIFNESKKIHFFQKSLRKAFIKEFKLASKGGFSSYSDWLEAKKWNVSEFSDWQLIKEVGLQSKEELDLFKEFEKKLIIYLGELQPNYEIPLEKLVDLILKEYHIDKDKTSPKVLVFKDFSREIFEDLLRKAIIKISVESEDFKYSRLKSSIIRIGNPISIENIEKPSEQTFECPNCRGKILKTSDSCPECGEKIEKCPICQIALVIDEISLCPYCKGEFHVKHLREVLKTSGKCPICFNRLQEKDIVLKKS